MLPHNSSLLVTRNKVRSASFTEKLGHVNNIFNFLLIFCIDSAARVKAESKVMEASLKETLQAAVPPSGAFAAGRQAQQDWARETPTGGEKKVPVLCGMGGRNCYLGNAQIGPAFLTWVNLSARIISKCFKLQTQYSSNWFQLEPEGREDSGEISFCVPSVALWMAFFKTTLEKVSQVYSNIENTFSQSDQQLSCVGRRKTKWRILQVAI